MAKPGVQATHCLIARHRLGLPPIVRLPVEACRRSARRCVPRGRKRRVADQQHRAGQCPRQTTHQRLAVSRAKSPVKETRCPVRDRRRHRPNPHSCATVMVVDVLPATRELRPDRQRARISPGRPSDILSGFAQRKEFRNQGFVLWQNVDRRVVFIWAHDPTTPASSTHRRRCSHR